MRLVFKFVKVFIAALAIVLIFKVIPVIAPMGGIFERIRDLGTTWFGGTGSGRTAGDKNGDVENQDRKIESADPEKETPKGNKPKTGEKEADAKENAKEEYFLTFEELIMSMQDMELKDKLKGISILNKLDKKELERVVEMTRDGITFDEAAKLKEMLQKSLEQKDIECLSDIIEKNKKVYREVGKPVPEIIGR